MKFQKFVPLAKMEEQPDGSLNVFGIVTAEQPDLENEVCDYAGTKPLYQAKVTAMFKLTSAVAGMEPSIMPMREMHQLKAIGAGRSIEFDDAAKTIKMGFNVVDPDAILKFRKGVLIGFSQGGAYVGDRFPDPVHKGCMRYIADPFEVSGVDSPCLPAALVESMKGRTVTLAKAVGVSEEVALQLVPADQARLIKAEREISELRQMLKAAKTKRVDGADLTADCFAYVGDLDDTATWILRINDEASIKAALAGFDKAGVPESSKKQARAKIAAAAKAAGIEVADADKAAISRACAKISLSKGLYEVGWLGDLLESLHWLCLQTEFERDMEEDGSKVPENLREAWMALLAEFKAMAIEEADELATAGRGEKGMKITDQAGLTKAAKTMAEHLEKHMEMHKALHEKMEGTLSKEHPIMKAHDAMMTHCEKCMKAAKDAGAGEEPEEADKTAPVAADAIAKAVAEALAPITTELTAIKAKMATTPANPPAHTGAGAVDKSMTIDADMAELLAK